MEEHSNSNNARTKRIIPPGCESSDLVAAMDRDDARGQVAHLHVLETGRLHHCAQGVLIRMLADGFGEVAITRLVVGDQLADAWQHLERMEVVQRPQPFLL